MIKTFAGRLNFGVYRTGADSYDPACEPANNNLPVDPQPPVHLELVGGRPHLAANQFCIRFLLLINPLINQWDT